MIEKESDAFSDIEFNDDDKKYIAMIEEKFKNRYPEMELKAIQKSALNFFKLTIYNI